MIKFKGTPGPWAYTNQSHGTFVMGLGHCVAKCNDFSGTEVSNANAILISKSPEILDALIKVHDFILKNKSKNYMIEDLNRHVPDLLELIDSATRIK